MTKIALLTQELINQIAAGEVIERPASVVKELIENALDAGATSISISIEDCGLKLISIADNGCGMLEADLKLAVLRHATSKLRTLEDLSAIQTLGFRGEALPSIASVSRLRIASRVAEKQGGYALTIEGGQIISEGPQGLPVGTTIEVRDLFFNTPARLKFMKTPATEQRAIVDVVSRYALACPGVRFMLEAGGRKLLNIPLEASSAERVQAVLGSNLRGQLTEFSKQAAGISVHGYLASPEITRPSRAAIYSYVNGRAVRDNQLAAAVIEGYRGQLMSGKYPVALLFIDIDPLEVDVNVHPAKAEVRFSKPSAVFGFIVSAVRAALNPQLERSSMLEAEPPRAIYRDMAAVTALPLREPSARTYQAPQALAPTPAVQTPLFEGRRSNYAGLELIGCLGASYLLLEDGQALYILDQHAAHERINFERLKSMDITMAPQQLLTPSLIELSRTEISTALELMPQLEAHGFVLEEFGETTLALRSIPAALSADKARALVVTLVHELQDGEIRRTNMNEDLLASLACHMSVKAGKALSQPEQLRLLNDLQACGSPQTCPHGRPLYKRITLEEIERWLGRRN